MSSSSLLQKRRAGVLLHPTSLPDSPGNGDLGPQAYHFVDFLNNCGARVWQMLPIGQPHSDRSPYQCLSVFAGNRWLISSQLLQQWGWLDSVADPAGYESDLSFRDDMLKRAWQQFEQGADHSLKQQFDEFVDEQGYWLRDYALYFALKQAHRGIGWQHWPDAPRRRHASAMRYARRRFEAQIRQVCFEQFVFHRQWLALKKYANEKGVLLFGDIPIFVAYDSADVWAYRRNFLLNEDGEMPVVSGVPPDYFSETGQKWGNPCYDWQCMQNDHFSWWKKRIFHQLKYFDMIRIDHFRGFESYWEVPAQAPTAQQGRWVKAPGENLFKSLLKKDPRLPLIAEDLGVITDEVRALRDQFYFPGMRIFQFGFDGDPANTHLPHNHTPNSVAYTGTHDNNTSLGWYKSLSPSLRENVLEYLGGSPEAMPWPLIRATLASVANLAVVPMQDVLGLGESHRMNVPGTENGNWSWRFQWSQVEDHAERFKRMVFLYNRAGD